MKVCLTLNIDLELPIAGRKHFIIPPGDEKIYKPFLKTFQIVNHHQERQEGTKKYPDLTNEEAKIYHSKKHFEINNGYEKYPEPTQIKTFEIANKRCDNEFTLEKIIVSKRRIQSVKQQRNGIDFAAPGDKFYKNPECTVDFFKEGGLIPGSTNTINYLKTVGKKSNNFYETLNLKKKTLNPNKIWSNKVKIDELAYQTDYVMNLAKWDKNFKKELPPLVESKVKAKIAPIKTKEVKKQVNKK